MSNATMGHKAPADRLDYGIDFSAWMPVGDTIITVTATLSGSTAVIDATAYTPTAVVVWISGGTDGDQALVKVVVTTQQARIKEFCFDLPIKDC